MSKLTNLKMPSEQQTVIRNAPRWLYNAWHNIHYMQNSSDVRRIVADTWRDEGLMHRMQQSTINQVRDIPGADPKKKNLVVFASGPSLQRYEEHLPWIFEHCYTIASPTQAPYFGDLGLEPDVMMAVDNHPVLADYVERSGLHRNSRTKLLACPEVSPALPSLFGAENTYWFRTAIPDREGNPDTEPYSAFITMLISMVNIRIAQLGCVTNMMVAIADALRMFAGWKWEKLVLIGADYAFVDNEMRVPTVAGGVEEDHKNADLIDRIVYEGPGNAGELETNLRMLRYKATLIGFWMQYMARWIYTMSHGILTEFPSVSIEQLKKGEFPDYPSEYHMGESATTFLSWFRADSRRRHNEWKTAQNKSKRGKGKLAKPTTAQVAEIMKGRT